MNSDAKKKLIGTNAVIWTTAMLVSFVLPFITDSITDGDANFLRAMSHVFPLICGLIFSNSIINKSIPEPVE
ncbi:MAG: hypothetical protein HKN47_25650 [Pirellulaceae bacterium]|nr:hypothetical protein [Pirellulaceae bacterium]